MVLRTWRKEHIQQHIRFCFSTLIFKLSAKSTRCPLALLLNCLTISLLDVYFFSSAEENINDFKLKHKRYIMFVPQSPFLAASSVPHSRRMKFGEKNGNGKLCFESELRSSLP